MDKSEVPVLLAPDHKRKHFRLLELPKELLETILEDPAKT